MYAVASILDTFTSERTKSLWGSLEQKCGMVGIQLVPLPHFSWQVADDYDIDAVIETMEDFSKELAPFVVQSAGLGIFTGPEPVLYLPIVKNRKLLEIHEYLWHSIAPYGRSLNTLYDKEQWIPHITLAYNDATPQNLACAVSDLSVMSLNVEILVYNFALIFKFEDRTGIEKKVNFKISTQNK